MADTDQTEQEPTATAPTPETNPEIDPETGLSQEVLAYLRKQHIHFLLPMYGGMCSEATFLGFIKFTLMARKLGVEWTIDTVTNESLITRGRNNLVAMFMANEKATHFMFIDVDLGFDHEAIFRLLLSNQDVVGGVYPMKCLPVQYVVNTLTDPMVIGKDLVEVYTLGTGFMLVQRHVVEKMIAAHPHLKYNDGNKFGPKYAPFMYALFDTMIDEHGNYLSEDWTFCYRWRKMGGKCFANTSIKLDHTGYHRFEGNPKTLQEHVLAKMVAHKTAQVQADFEAAKAASEAANAEAAPAAQDDTLPAQPSDIVTMSSGEAEAAKPPTE